MIEGVLFVLELVAMLLLLRAVFQEGRRGDKPSLGVFAYREDLSPEDLPKARSPRA